MPLIVELICKPYRKGLKMNDHTVMEALNDAARECYDNSIAHGFWEGDEWTPGEKIALMHSELSEALEVLRKDPNEMSKKTPECLALEEELADTLIHIFDFCGKMNLNIGRAVIRKMAYNRSRPYKHGKKF